MEGEDLMKETAVVSELALHLNPSTPVQPQGRDESPDIIAHRHAATTTTRNFKALVCPHSTR